MKKIICSILSIILVLGMIFACTSCQEKKSDISKINDNNVIYIGITIYPPMDYFGDDGETIVGFDADLANAFALSLGIKAKFVPISWDSKVLELNGGYIDLIWNGMTKIDSLDEQIDFSLAYATNYQCVVVKNDVSSYTSKNVLSSKKVAVEQGSAGDTSVSDLGVNANKVGSQLDALNEVVAGTSDCAVIDYTMAYNTVGKGNYSDLKIVAADKISFDQEVFAIGARTGSDILPKLNEFLKKAFADGMMNDLAEKYGVALNEDELK